METQFGRRGRTTTFPVGTVEPRVDTTRCRNDRVECVCLNFVSGLGREVSGPQLLSVVLCGAVPTPTGVRPRPGFPTA